MLNEPRYRTPAALPPVRLFRMKFCSQLVVVACVLIRATNLRPQVDNGDLEIAGSGSKQSRVIERSYDGVWRDSDRLYVLSNNTK